MDKSPTDREVYQHQVANALDSILAIATQEDITDVVLLAACARLYVALLFNRGFTVAEFDYSLACLRKDYVLKFMEKQDAKEKA